MRFESISKSPREVERKSSEDLKSEAGNAVSGQSKVSEDLPEQVRVMRDTLQIGFCEEREAREMTSAKSEIQGSAASVDHATQARLTEAKQVAEHQEIVVDRLTKHCKSLNGKRSKQADKDAAAVSQLEADQAQTINV